MHVNYRCTDMNFKIFCPLIDLQLIEEGSVRSNTRHFAKRTSYLGLVYFVLQLERACCPSGINSNINHIHPKAVGMNPPEYRASSRACVGK